jgi:murein DD-endopeptidase MepM/ murein hydrolase activator NlpD
MQLLVTHEGTARTRVLQLSRLRILLIAAALLFVLLAASGTVYHFVFLKAAREGWPVVSPLVRLIVRDELAQQERYMRDNLDAMAGKLGEMQAKLVRLEAMGERVSGLAGLRTEELQRLDAAASAPDGAASASARPAATPSRASSEARGGPYLPLQQPSLEELRRAVDAVDAAADWTADLFTYFESRLQESRLTALLVPSQVPVDVPVGSGFGFRTDPFNGRAALHTGLDFPAPPGTPIVAAAGGLVITKEWHPAYGQMLEIDHGNGLVTRYAHCLGIDVELGALVRRGQPVARVGSSGRSTGPHLHFEVLVDGVPQNPRRFLASAPPRPAFAERPTPRPR